MVRTRDRPGQAPGAIGIDVRTQWQRDHTGARRDADEPRGDRHRRRPRGWAWRSRAPCPAAVSRWSSATRWTRPPPKPPSRRCWPRTALRSRSVPMSPTSSTWRGCSRRRPRRSRRSTSSRTQLHAWRSVTTRRSAAPTRSSGPICRARSSSIDRRRVVRPGGTIVNLCVEQFGAPTSAAGLGSNGVIGVMTRALARELREHDVTVDAVRVPARRSRGTNRGRGHRGVPRQPRRT